MKIPWGYYALLGHTLHERTEFDKNANSVSVRVRKLICADWFGDYRSLRFLCGCFGSRTFYFM